MTQPTETAREAAERNAQAVMNGDLTQVMADITPEAMAQMMQMGAEAQANGVPAPTAMPSMESYTVEPVDEDADSSVFHVTFVSSAGSATLATTWQPIAGQWKIAAVSLVSSDVDPGKLQA